MQPLDFIFLAVKRGVKRKILLANLVSCSADNTYTQIKLSCGLDFMVAKPIRFFEEHLPKSIFCRISRSAIVNVHHVLELDSCSPKLTLTDNSILKPEKNKLPLLEELITSSQGYVKLG